MSFLEIKLRGAQMDASKKLKKEVEVKAAEEQDARRVRRFILNGDWPKDKVVLTTEDREKIIWQVLDRTNNIFKYLSGFVPIRHIINHKAEGMEPLFITSEKDVIFSEGVNLETHCYEVCSQSLQNIKRSEDEYFEESKLLLITRKQEWIVWHRELEKTFSEAGSRYISRLAKFEKVKDISQFLEGSGALLIVDVFYLWFYSDISGEEKRLEEKRRLRDYLQNIYERVGQVTGR
jgi:hypothetical protein